MARDEQRNINLQFLTNAEETKSKIDNLLNSLDKTDESYDELQQQSVSLASAIEDVNNAMENGSSSSNILQTSINKLEGETKKATQSFNKVTTATDKQAKSTKNLTSEVTSNGGAISILDSLTGGYASRTRDALEATKLFTAGTGVSTIAQRAYAAVVGTSTGAMKAFRIALAATGIGLAVVAIGFLVDAFIRLRGATDDATDAQRRFNLEMAKADFEKQISLLDNYTELAKEHLRERGADIEEIRRIEDEEYEKRAKALNDYYFEIKDLDEAEADRTLKALRDLHLRQGVIEARRRADDAEALRNQSKNNVDTYKASNKKMTESDEDRHKKWMALQKEKEDTLEKIKDLTIEVAGEPSAVALNESEKKVATLIKQWSSLGGALANQFDKGVISMDVFDDQIKDLDDAYLELIAKEEMYQDEMQKRFGFVATLVSEYDTLRLTDQEGNLLGYQYVREEIIKLSDDLKGPVKDAFDNWYNVDKVKKDFEVMNKYFGETTTLATKLLSYDESGEGIAITGLFGKDSKNTINDKVEEVRLANERILNEQEKLALAVATTEKEVEAVRQYYRDQRELNDKKAEEERLNRDKKAEEERLNRMRANTEAEIAIVNASADAQAASLDMVLSFMSDEDAERTKATGAYKTLAIATATMDTYAAAIAGYKGAMQTFANPIVGNIVGIASIATAVSTGIAQINAIRKVKVPGGGSGGGGSISASSAGAAPNVSFVSSSENQIANSVTGAMNNQNQEPIKAYVVSSDVSSGQALERNKIESNSI